MTNTNDSPQRLGSYAERKVRNKLSAMGFFVRRMPILSPFDLLVNDKRVEVKTATLNKRGQWMINIHRHGVLNETKVDAYVVVLDGKELNKANRDIYLVFEAPLNKMTVAVTLMSLLNEHHANLDRWDLLGDPIREELRRPSKRHPRRKVPNYPQDPTDSLDDSTNS